MQISRVNFNSTQTVLYSSRFYFLYLSTFLLDNIWLQFLEQVVLENQKYLEASEHPSAYSLAYKKNVKLADVLPEVSCPQTEKSCFFFFPNGGYISGSKGYEEQRKFFKNISTISDITCTRAKIFSNASLCSRNNMFLYLANMGFSSA